MEYLDHQDWNQIIVTKKNTSNKDPDKLSKVWSEVLDSKLIIRNNLPQVVLENASITFVEAKSDYSDLVGITLKASEERLKMGKNIRILGLDVEFVG